jgi:putative Holliday junction resolvase
VKRIIGIDYGSTRIGIAVSDPLRVIARGVRVIENSTAVIDEIKQLIDEFDPEAIVIGMPLNLKGEKGISANNVERFIAKLESEIALPIMRYDERFTSELAHQTLREMGVPKKKRQVKATIDTMAAALILQGYLDRQAV